MAVFYVDLFIYVNRRLFFPAGRVRDETNAAVSDSYVEAIFYMLVAYNVFVS